MRTGWMIYGALAALAGSCADRASSDRTDPASAGDAPAVAQRERPVAGYSQHPVAIAPPSSGPPFLAPAAVWPAAATVEVALTDAAVPATGLAPAGVAVRVEAAFGDNAPRRVQLESFARAATAAAGVNGVLLRVSRTDGGSGAGPARVTLDYRAFRWAYGGDWASRLALWSVPDCALTTPGALGCRGTRLTAVNDVAAGTVSAIVDVGAPATALAMDAATAPSSGGTLMMLAASDAGAGGDFRATSLAPTAAWIDGASSGDFSWSYPIRVPASLGGPAPKIAFAYSSANVDGRTASTNNQASWIGEGFDWQPGAIERRYVGCADDMGAGANNTEKTGDLCWDTDNASISLAGQVDELLKDPTTPNLWHLRGDDGTRVEHRTGGPNSDDDGEWWVVTSTDGTQYWFGGRAGSNATLTVPVFGNHSGEPCHQAAFKDSACVQAYRWMLDRVVDPLGNTMSLSYAKETNKYGKNNTPGDDTVYDRDGYLTKIEYGTRTDSVGSAPMQVVFTVADRCLSGCTTKDAQHWPDVPWDRECTADTCGLDQTSPTFWSTKRLASITTQVWGDSAYRDVESWTLTHSFPSSDQPTLWLARISHSGLVGGTVSLPDVSFAGVAMANRVDTDADQYPAMNHYRLKTITTESGGKTDITYSAPDCVRGTRVPDQSALQDNVLRCFPVRWTPSGLLAPINDFFQRYVVTDVVEADLSGASSRTVVHYDYLGDPAWHYTDDDGLIRKDDKTWSVWRGYGAVRVTKGDSGEQTSEEHRFFRGMHGDKLPSGTRTVSLPAIGVGNVPAVDDDDAFAGQLRETITFNGPGGAEVTATVNEPWQSAPTATRTINGSTVEARHTNIAVVHTRTALDGGRGYRTTAATTTFDAYGMPIQIDDRGDEAVTGDERCTLTDYVRNTTAWIIDKPARERAFAVSCSQVQAGGLGDGDVVDETRSSYDGQAWNVAPTRGALTRVDGLLAYNGGSPSFQTQLALTYDSYGRPLTSTDVRGNTTTIAYQPATGGPVTGTTETTQLGWVTSTTIEPAWSLPLAVVDPNGRKTETAYDPLGRVTAIWLPGRDRATESASLTLDHLVRNDAPTVITTQRLNPSGGYVTSYKFFDSLLRERQTQELDEAGSAGALVTDIYYDSAGREVKTHDSYLAADAAMAPVPPSTNLFVPTQCIPRLQVTQYDGADRELAVIEKVNGPPTSPGGTELWRTTYAYGGDRTDVTPPAGGTATSEITDARDNVIERRQYQAGHAAGSATGFDATFYQYNRKNELAAMTDAGGIRWQYTYDVLGRVTQEIDPDQGTTITTYTPFGDVETSTDSRGVTIAYTYDSLGRKTTLRDGSVTGSKRAEWIYDTMANGTQVFDHEVRAIRYDGAAQYVVEPIGFAVDYQPTGVKYTIPAAATGVTGSYTYAYTYNQDHSIATVRLPALGDLALETLTHGYDRLGKPATLATSLGATLVAAPGVNMPGTEYTSLGEVAAIHLRNNAGAQVDLTRSYDVATRRLTQIKTARATAPTVVADVRYTYDAAGNVTGISDVTAGDHQCFQTDHLQRLTDAWTPASGDCSAAPTTAGLGGPARYWQSFSYDAVGNRTHLSEHASAGDRNTSYTVAPGAHRLTGATIVAPSGTTMRAYSYDATGNLTSRPTPAADTQTMTWDAEGHLASRQEATGTTTYIYDADGDRLLRQDPTGTTLYLPDQELRYTVADGAKHAVRYYYHVDELIAMRTAADGVVWLAGDHHGTAEVSIGAVDQAAAIRRELPFGELRDTEGAWPAELDLGFVGGVDDDTGLVHLGAREYDPELGRFLSVDPIIDQEDPQQMGGYAYADDAPNTAEDADGLWPNWGHIFRSVAHSIRSAPSRAFSWFRQIPRFVSREVHHAAHTIEHDFHRVSHAIHHSRHVVHHFSHEVRRRVNHEVHRILQPRGRHRVQRHVGRHRAPRPPGFLRKVGEYAAPLVLPVAGPVTAYKLANKPALSQGIIWGVSSTATTVAESDNPRYAILSFVFGFGGGYYSTLIARDFPSK